MEMSNITQPPYGHPLTLDEIAKLFGVRKQAVHNVEQQALRKLARDPEFRKIAIEFGFMVDREAL